MRYTIPVILVLASLGAVLLVLAGSAMGATQEESEPNDDVASADLIVEGRVTGRVDGMDSIDLFKFYITPGDVIEIGLKADWKQDTDLLLVEAKTQEPRDNVSSMNNVLREITVPTSESSGDLWYIVVSTEYMYLANYQIFLTIRGQDDAGLGRDAGDGITRADEVQPDGTRYYGTLAGADSSDFFKVWTGKGVEMTIRFTSYATRYNQVLTLYEGRGEDDDLFALTSTDGSLAVRSFLTSDETELQWWYINVSLTRDNDGAYEFVVSLEMQTEVTTTENLWGHKDAGGSIAEADDEYLHMDTYYGKLGAYDSVDCYKTKGEPGASLYMNLHAYNVLVDSVLIELLDEDEKVIWYNHSNGDNSKKLMLTSADDEASWFYIRLRWEDFETRTYHLNINWRDQDDAGTEADVASDLEDALELPDDGGYVNVQHTGAIGDLDLSDAYRFQMGRGLGVDIRFGAPLLDHRGSHLYLHLYAPEDVDDPVRTVAANSTTGLVSMMYYTALEREMGYWYLVVSNDEGVLSDVGDPLPYEFKVLTLYQNDMRTAGDAPGVEDDAIDVYGGTLGESNTGLLKDEDDVDCYEIYSGMGDILIIHFAARTSECTVNLSLKDADGHDVLVIDSIDYQEVTTRFYTDSTTTPIRFVIVVSKHAKEPLAEYYLYVVTGFQNDGGSGQDAELAMIDPRWSGPDFTGELYDIDDMDSYEFEAGNGQIIEVGFNAPTGMRLTFMTDPDHVFFTLDGTGAAGPADSYYTAFETEPQEWLIEVEAEAGVDGTYVFSVALTDQPEWETGHGDMIGHDLQELDPLLYPPSPDLHVEGVLFDLDTRDMYTFDTCLSNMVTIELTSTTLQKTVSLLEKYEDEPLWTAEVEAGETATTSLYTSFEVGVIIFVVVEGEGEYELTVSEKRQDDAGYDSDASENGWGNPPVEEGKYEANIGDCDQVDVYRVEVMSGWTLDIVNFSEGRDGGLEMEVQDENMDVVDTLVAEVDTDYSIVIPLGPDPIPGEEPYIVRYWYLSVAGDASWKRGPYGFEVYVDKEPQDVTPPDVTHDPPTDASSQEDLTITVTLEDASGVTSATLYYRMEGETEWRSIEMTQDGDQWSATIPAEDLEPGTVEYYIEATDGAGNEVHHGSITAPLYVELETLPPDKEDEPGFGALACAVAIAVGVLYQRRRRG